jgi:GWxTD domain-containing protein
MVFYRGVCEANLGHPDKAEADFERFLAVQPNTSMDPSMYSKNAIAAFEAARKNLVSPSDSGKGKPSLFLAFQEFKTPPNSADQAGSLWAEGPVRWIMTSDEKRRWSELSQGGADLQEFVEQFWEARNPQRGNPDNAFKTTFERRAAFADTYFLQDEETRGSLTDRGMVFVLLGPPTYAGKKPLRTGEDTNDPSGMTNDITGPGLSPGVSGAPRISAYAAAGSPRILDAQQNWREVWHYRRELLPKGVGYHQVDVEFITKKGYGSNVMQRDQPTLATLEAARAGSAPKN